MLPSDIAISRCCHRYSPAITFRGGVCTIGASSAALNETTRRSFPTGRYSVSRCTGVRASDPINCSIASGGNS